METVGGERSTAPTNNPTTSIDVLGHKLGQELLDSGISIENQNIEIKYFYLAIPSSASKKLFE